MVNVKETVMKKQLTQLMPTLVVMVLILVLTVATYNISLRQEEEECFNRLENASETMVQSIKNRVNDDLNYLRLIGKDFSNEDHLPTYEEYKDRLSTFEDVSLFERVDLLMKNNTLYTMHDEVQQIYTNEFLVLNSTAEYMDRVHTDTLTNKRSVNYYVPIQQNETVIAYLVGVFQCDTMDDQFYTKILNGKTHNSIIDTTDGQVVMDNQDLNIDNIASDTDFKLLSPKKNVLKQIHSLKSGAFASEKNGEKKYFVYKPVGVCNWELLVMVNEEDAFANVLTLKNNYMVMVICEILILLLYCGFYITIVRRISKKSDELNEDLNGLQEIFLDNSYRVGGDEFVVIGQDVSELLFFDQYAKLLKRMKELEISVATGCVWKETCSNLSETLQEAIKRCMKIKSDIIL